MLEKMSTGQEKPKRFENLCKIHKEDRERHKGTQEEMLEREYLVTQAW